MARYSIGGSYPRELKQALSGFPCIVKDDLAALEIKFEQAAMLTGIRVSGTSFVEQVKGGPESSKKRLVSNPIFIHLNHSGPHKHSHDAERHKSSWSGRIAAGAGQSQFVIFSPCTSEGEGAASGSAFMEFRDVGLTVQSAETGLCEQLSALFDDAAALGAMGDAVEVQLVRQGGGGAAPRLFASKFVLQLRSPVFRAELGSAFAEGRSRQLQFHDFPDIAVRCFMELLHRDTYTGSPAPDELVAMFALGDKYDVPFVQEVVYNQLSELELSPAELRRAVDAIRSFRAVPLRRALVKKMRQLGDDEFCGLVYGDSDEACQLPKG
mmetsp:Transcript_79612/g.246908  ORF Transcript_79612/g.246908 Transcript_79612/m.246908 type:complete len:324 (-) Transcript_79612:113-1084(-)